MTYRRKIFLYFFLVFIGFAVIIILFQHSREKEYKVGRLTVGLEAYADLIDKSLELKSLDSVAELENILPERLRYTIVDNKGIVLFDNTIDSGTRKRLDNHIDRPEIVEAKYHGEGLAVRYSDTKKREYYYYAKQFGEYYVRVALPDDIYLQESLQADSYFLYFIITIFFVVLIVLFYVSDKLGRSISSLKEFLYSVENNDFDFTTIKFPSSEIGEIGAKIIQAYALVRSRNEELDRERAKLIRHFQYLQEGISIYSPLRESVYTNSHFIQHLNTIKDDATFNSDDVFLMDEFTPVVKFLEENLPLAATVDNINNLPVWQGVIEKGGHHFAVKLVIFKDSTFELTLNNVTKQENNKQLKQEMTNNIAHELRTPVSSVSGYLETILTQENMSEERKVYFLNRAYVQVKRLSDLIRDIALITKTESAPNFFDRKEISIPELLDDLKLDFEDNIAKANASFFYSVADDVSLVGNYTLLYSIFRNLTENSLKYGGENVAIVVENYAHDDDFYYFKFSNSGESISQEHISRIFDRFYRIDHGRSRSAGGSGLGLSIVKNAVLFHGGEITAKSNVGRGVEFIFSLSRKL